MLEFGLPESEHLRQSREDESLRSELQRNKLENRLEPVSVLSGNRKRNDKGRTAPLSSKEGEKREGVVRE